MDLTPIYNLEQLSMLDIPNRKCYPVKINYYWNWDDYGKIRKNWLTEKNKFTNFIELRRV